MFKRSVFSAVYAFCYRKFSVIDVRFITLLSVTYVLCIMYKLEITFVLDTTYAELVCCIFVTRSCARSCLGAPEGYTVGNADQQNHLPLHTSFEI